MSLQKGMIGACNRNHKSQWSRIGFGGLGSGGQGTETPHQSNTFSFSVYLSLVCLARDCCTLILSISAAVVGRLTF